MDWIKVSYSCSLLSLLIDLFERLESVLRDTLLMLNLFLSIERFRTYASGANLLQHSIQKFILKGEISFLYSIYFCLIKSNRMLRIFTICLLNICVLNFMAAQNDVYEEVKYTDMSIPSAPAFAILGVNPETVLRPSDLKSFKVDWRIKNYNLAPDLALEAQPLWHFYYKKKSFDEYADASTLAKKLSTISLSLGTAKIDGINHASVAVKLNLYKENDPIEDRNLLEEISGSHKSLINMLNEEIDSLIALRYRTTNPKEKEKYENQLEAKRLEKSTVSENAKARYREMIEFYNADNWNRSMLDFAFGRVYTYDNAGLDSIKVRSAGLALWLNGCLRAGKNGLLTGIVKYTKVFDNSNSMLGMSYRYGSLKYNFFAEAVYESLGNFFDPEQENTFNESEIFAGKFVEDLGSGWLDFNNEGKYKQYTFAFGGDFKLSRNILLNFAIRTQFTGDMKMRRLLPVANVVCLMK
jgi:hypothetical protein